MPTGLFLNDPVWNVNTERRSPGLTRTSGQQYFEVNAGRISSGIRLDTKYLLCASSALSRTAMPRIKASREIRQGALTSSAANQSMLPANTGQQRSTHLSFVPNASRRTPQPDGRLPIFPLCPGPSEMLPEPTPPRSSGSTRRDIAPANPHPPTAKAWSVRDASPGSLC